MAKRELVYEPEFPDEEEILSAFKDLFSDEKGMIRQFSLTLQVPVLKNA